MILNFSSHHLLILQEWLEKHFIDKYEYFYSDWENDFSIELLSNTPDPTDSSFTRNSTCLFLNFEKNVYLFFYNTTSMEFNYNKTLIAPKKINSFVYNTILGKEALVMVSNQDVLYYSFEDELWISVFKTRYQLTHKVVVDNLDLDPYNEIIFAVNGYDSSIDVVRADWSESISQWRLLSTLSYSDIVRVYDINSGHLMNHNYGYIIVAHDKGVDMALVNYTETVQDLNEDISHDMQAIQTVNGLYEEFPTDPYAVNWMNDTGKIHYENESFYYEEEFLPVGFSFYHLIHTAGSLENLHSKDPLKIWMMPEYEIISQNYLYETDGNLIFTMPNELQTNTNFIIYLNGSFSGTVYSCDVYAIDNSDIAYYLGDLKDEPDNAINTAFTGTIKEIKLQFSNSEEESSWMNIDTVSVTHRLLLSAPQGYEILNPNIDSISNGGSTPNPLATLQTTTMDGDDLISSRLMDPYTGGYTDGFSSETEDTVNFVSDFGIGKYNFGTAGGNPSGFSVFSGTPTNWNVVSSIFGKVNVLKLKEADITHDFGAPTPTASLECNIYIPSDNIASLIQISDEYGTTLAGFKIEGELGFPVEIFYLNNAGTWVLLESGSYRGQWINLKLNWQHGGISQNYVNDVRKAQYTGRLGVVSQIRLTNLLTSVYIADLYIYNDPDIDNGYFTIDSTDALGVKTSTIDGLEFFVDGSLPNPDFADYNNIFGTVEMGTRTAPWTSTGTPPGYTVESGSTYTVVSSYGGRSYPLQIQSTSIKKDFSDAFLSQTVEFYMYVPRYVSQQFITTEFVLLNTYNNPMMGVRFYTDFFSNTASLYRIHGFSEYLVGSEGGYSTACWYKVEISWTCQGSSYIKIGSSTVYSTSSGYSGAVDKYRLKNGGSVSRSSYFDDIHATYGDDLIDVQIPDYNVEYYDSSSELQYIQNVESSTVNYLNHLLKFNFDFIVDSSVPAGITEIKIIPNINQDVDITSVDLFEVMGNLNEWGSNNDDKVDLREEIIYDLGTDFSDVEKFKTVIPIETSFKAHWLSDTVSDFTLEDYKFDTGHTIEYWKDGGWHTYAGISVETVSYLLHNIILEEPGTNLESITYLDGGNYKLKIRVSQTITFTQPYYAAIKGMALVAVNTIDTSNIVSNKYNRIESSITSEGKYLTDVSTEFETLAPEIINPIENFEAVYTTHTFFNLTAIGLDYSQGEIGEGENGFDFYELYQTSGGITRLPIQITVTDISGNPIPTTGIMIEVSYQGVTAYSNYGDNFVNLDTDLARFDGAIPDTFEISIIATSDNKLTYFESERQYILEWSLWSETEYDWLLLNNLPVHEISFKQDLSASLTCDVDLYIGENALTERGNYEQIFEYYINKNEIDFNISELEAFEIEIDGMINHFVFDAMTSGLGIWEDTNLFDYRDHPIDNNNWVIHNNQHSFLQIYNEGTGTFEDITTVSNFEGRDNYTEAFDGQFGLRYYLYPETSLEEFGYSKGNPDLLYFKFKLLVDQSDYIDNDLDPDISNFLSVDIDGFSFNAITARDPEDQSAHNLEKYRGDHYFEFDLPSTDPESITISLDLELNVNITTLGGINLQANDNKFVWIEPSATFYLQTAETKEYIQIGLDPVAELTFDDWLAHFKFTGTVDLYSINQMNEFIKFDGTSKTMSGYLMTNWYFLNNRLGSIVSTINITNENFVNASAITWEREQERLTDDLHENLDIGDLDGDGDLDVLLDMGSAIIIQANTVTYDMKMIAIDNETKEIICEQYFLGSMDTGSPHPEFYEFLDGEIPELSEIFTLNVIDYSYDLDSVSLLWSTTIDGTYTNIETIDLDPNDHQNYFAFSVNSSTLDIPEGTIYFKVSCVDDDTNTGEDIIQTIVDRTAPISDLSIEIIPPTDGLVAYWEFDGDSTDSIGNNDAIEKNGITLTTDRFNNPNSAYYFDGIDDYLLVNSFTLNREGSTLSWWMQSDDALPSCLFSNVESQSYASHFFWNHYGSRYIWGETNMNGNEIDFYDTSTSVDTDWHHYALVFSNKLAYLYIDGVNMGEATDYGVTTYGEGGTTAYEMVADTTLKIFGAWSDYGDRDEVLNRFKGKMDEIRVYNRALSIDSIAKLYYDDIPCESLDTVSIQSDLGFPIAEINSVNSFNLEIYSMTNELLFSSTISSPVEITYDLLQDIINVYEITESQLQLRYFAIDEAGNVESINEQNIIIDNDYNIKFYTDETYTTEITGDLEVQYEDNLYGIATDSFGLPLPKGFDLDLQLANLTYIRTKIINEVGQFSAQILSADMYSEDLRSFEGVEINGYNGEFSQDKTIPIIYPNVQRNIQVDGLKRYFPYKSSRLYLEYDGLDLNETILNGNYEGFRFDLIIPAVYNEITGGTFTQIDITFDFELETENETINDSFVYSIDSKRIVDALQKDPMQFAWSGMLVSVLPIDISFAEMAFFNTEASSAAITRIKISGVDNNIHPNFDFSDPTYSYQALGSAGIYLLDIINNCTLLNEINSKGNPITYDLEGRIRTSILKDFSVSNNNNFRILPTDVSLSIPDPVIESIYYGENLTISGISMNSPFMDDISSIPTDFLSLSVLNTSSMEYITVGTPLNLGVSSTMGFSIRFYPGNYTRLTLNYSGNALFAPTSIEISPLFEIKKKNVILDIGTQEIGDILDYHIPRNSTNILIGLILTEDRLPLMENFPEQQEITFYDYIENSYVPSMTKNLSANAIIISMDWGGTFYPIDYTFLQYGEFFSFDISTCADGNLNRMPGEYILAIEYIGTKNYYGYTRYFTVNIDPTEVGIEIRESITELWETNSTLFISELTYTDSKDFEVRVEDLYERNQQDGRYEYLTNIPVWLEIGFLPNSPYMDQMTEDFTDCWGEYLVLQNENSPDNLMLRYYEQDLGEMPILYPYFDLSSDSFKTFAPLYYQMGITDSDGIAKFSVHGNTTINIAQDYVEKLHYSVESLDSVTLYIRAFYDNQFDASLMQIPEYTYLGETYEVDLYNNAPWIYDSSDDLVEITNNPFYRNNIYADPYHKSGWVEGKVFINPEDTMILASRHDIYEPNFMVHAMIVEANVENDVLVPEYFDESNFIHNYGINYNGHMDKFAVELNIYNRENTTQIIDGAYNEGEYNPYILWVDDDSLVTFPCNDYIFGPQMDRLVPGSYNLHFLTALSDSVYYKEPTDAYAELKLIGPASQRLDAPSHLYSFYEFITYDPSSYVIWSDSTGGENYAEYDSNYPVLNGTIEFSASRFLNGSVNTFESYNSSETIIVDIMINDLKYDSFYIENVSAWDGPFEFSYPLKFMHDQSLNLTLETRFEYDPEANINFTKYEDLYEANESNFDPEANATNWDYWDEFIQPYIDTAWDQYAPYADYKMAIWDLKIVQSNLYHDGQTWVFQNELDTGTDRVAPYQYMDNDLSEHWTQLNGSVQESVDFLNVTIGEDDTDSFIETQFNSSEIVIQFDNSSITNWTSPENQFNVTYDFRDLFTVELLHWNTTDVSVDYQMYSGFQLDNYYANDEKYNHSVRTAFLHRTYKEPMDGTYFGLYNQESAAFYAESFYMPWMGEIDYQVLIPKFDHLNYNNLEVQIEFYLEEENNEENNHYNQTTIINTSDTSLNNPIYPDDLWKDLSIKIPDQFHSRMVNMYVNVSILNSSESEIIPVYLIGGYIMGQENIISISTAYPEKLRHRMFSTNYLYYFMEYAQDIGLTQCHNVSSAGNVDVNINDAHFEILEYNGSAYGVKDIRDIMNVRNERSWTETGFDDQTGEWDWPAFTEENVFDWFTYYNPTQDKRLPSLNTFVEFYDENTTVDRWNSSIQSYSPENITTLKSAINLKFNESVLDEIEDPEIYSGFVSISDCYFDYSDFYHIREQSAATRKLTVFVYPAFWNQTIQRTGIQSSASGSPRNGITTHIVNSSVYVNSSIKSNYTEYAALNYHLDPSSDDIVVNQWSERFIEQGVETYTPTITHDIDQSWYITDLDEIWTGKYQKPGIYQEYDFCNYYEDYTYEPYDDLYIVDYRPDMSIDQIEFDVSGQSVSVSNVDTVTINYRFGVLLDGSVEWQGYELSLLIDDGGTSGWSGTVIDEVIDWTWWGDMDETFVEGQYTLTDEDMDLLYQENGQYTGLKISFMARTIDTILINELWVYIDYIEVVLSNAPTRLFWDDWNSLTYKDLFTMTHYNYEVCFDVDGHSYFVDDERELFTGIAGYGANEFFMTEISNWKRTYWEGWFGDPPIYWDDLKEYPKTLGNFIEQDVVVLDFDNDPIYNIYEQPIHRVPSQYDYIKIPIYLSDAPNITALYIRINYGDGTHDDIDIMLKDELSEIGFYYNEIDHFINGKRIENIKFDFRFNESASAEIVSTFALGGIALFTPDSAGILTVGTNNTDYMYPILPAVFSDVTIPNTKEIELRFDTESEIIEDLTIEGTHEEDLYLYSCSLVELYKSENYTSSDLDYYYEFDEYHRNLNRRMTDWYSPSEIENEWEELYEGNIFSENLTWIHQYSLDFNGDANYDLIIEEFDGEGKGDFDNNIQDYIRMDFGADGYWDYQIFIDIQDLIIQGTEPELHGMDTNIYGGEEGNYFVFNIKRELIETSYDTNGDGMFDYKGELFYTWQSFAIPEYRQWEIIDRKLVHWNDILWNPGVQGIKYSVDADGDGYFEEVIERTDRWENSDWVLDDMNPNYIFETYDYKGADFEEHDNMLIENTSFYLCGPDIFLLDENGFIQFDNSGNPVYNRTKITGEFIFEYDVKVPIDPRYNATDALELSLSNEELPELLCDEHGVLAWYDSNSDGKMDIAFVFTEKSWVEDQMAIGIYHCRSGYERVQTNTNLYRMSGDQFFPLHWLSFAYNYTDLMGVAWTDSKDQYFDQVEHIFTPGQGNSFSATFWVDTIAQAIIMGGSAMISSAIFGGSLFGGPAGGITAGVISFVGVMAANMYYQYWIRPDLISAMSECGIWGMEKEIPLWNADPEDYDPWEALKGSFTDFNSHDDVRYVDQGIIFQDKNIWYSDTRWKEEDESLQHYIIEFDIPIYGTPGNPTLSVLEWVVKWYDVYRIENNIDDYIPDIKNFDKWELYDETIELLEEAYDNDYDSLRRSYTACSGTDNDLSWIADAGESIFNSLVEPLPPDYSGELARSVYEQFWLSQMSIIDGNLTSTDQYRSTQFSLDSAGRPFLIPTYNSGKNLSDPIQKEIDFLEMAFLSCYWKEFNAFRSADPAILATQLGLSAFQVLIGVLASNLGTAMVKPTAYLQNYQGSAGAVKWVKDLVKEMWEETLLEEAISWGAYQIGFSKGFADLLGESIGMGKETIVNINKISTYSTSNFLNVYEQLTGYQYPTTYTFEQQGVLIEYNAKISKTEVMAEIANILCQAKGAHITQKLKGNTKLINSLEHVINTQMGSNIDLKHTVDILSNLPMKEFHPERSGASDMKFKQKFTDRLFSSITRSGGINAFLNSMEMLEEFNCLDAQGKVINYVKLVSITKGGATRTYYPKDFNNPNSVNQHIIEYKDGHIEIKATPDSLTTAEVFSESVSAIAIDPVVSNHYVDKLLNLFKRTDLICLMQEFSNLDGEFYFLKKHRIHNDPIESQKFLTESIQGTALMTKFALEHYSDIRNAHQNFKDASKRKLSGENRLNLLLAGTRSLKNLFPTHEIYGNIMEQVFLGSLRFNDKVITNKNQENNIRQFILELYRDNLNAEQMLIEIQEKLIEINPAQQEIIERMCDPTSLTLFDSIIGIPAQINDWFKTFLMIGEFAQTIHDLINQIGLEDSYLVGEIECEIFLYALNFFPTGFDPKDGQIFELESLTDEDGLMDPDIGDFLKTLGMTIKQFIATAHLNALFAQSFDMFIGQQDQINDIDAANSFLNLFLQDQYSAIDSSSDGYAGREFINHILTQSNAADMLHSIVHVNNDLLIKEEVRMDMLMRYHERLRIDAELLAALSQPEVVMLTRKIIEDQKIDILKYNPATSQYEIIEKGLWGHGELEFAMNLLLLSEETIGGTTYAKVDRNSRYCGTLTDEDTRIYLGYTSIKKRYALRFVDSYGLHLFHQNTREHWTPNQEHNIAFDQILQTSYLILNGGGRRKLDGASMVEILDYTRTSYLTEKDVKAGVAYNILGIAVEHVCKDSDLAIIRERDRIIGKYTPLTSKTQNEILKAYMKGNFEINVEGVSKTSGQLSKKQAIQYMLNAESFIEEASELFGVSESEISAHIKNIQRAYGWNPTEQSWTEPNIVTTNPAEFVADTQGYWYYYENAYELDLQLYDIVNHCIIPGLVENKMYHYMMIGRTSTAGQSGYSMTVIVDGTPTQVFFFYSDQFQSEYGTTFVQGDINQEYVP